MDRNKEKQHQQRSSTTSFKQMFSRKSYTEEDNNNSFINRQLDKGISKFMQGGRPNATASFDTDLFVDEETVTETIRTETDCSHILIDEDDIEMLELCKKEASNTASAESQQQAFQRSSLKGVARRRDSITETEEEETDFSSEFNSAHKEGLMREKKSNESSTQQSQDIDFHQQESSSSELQHEPRRSQSARILPCNSDEPAQPRRSQSDNYTPAPDFVAAQSRMILQLTEPSEEFSLNTMDTDGGDESCSSRYSSYLDKMNNELQPPTTTRETTPRSQSERALVTTETSSSKKALMSQQRKSQSERFPAAAAAKSIQQEEEETCTTAKTPSFVAAQSRMILNLTKPSEEFSIDTDGDESRYSSYYSELRGRRSKSERFGPGGVTSDEFQVPKRQSYQRSQSERFLPATSMTASTLQEQLNRTRMCHAQKVPRAPEPASVPGAVSIPGAFQDEVHEEEEEKVEEEPFTEPPDPSHRPSFIQKFQTMMHSRRSFQSNSCNSRGGQRTKKVRRSLRRHWISSDISCSVEDSELGKSRRWSTNSRRYSTNSKRGSMKSLHKGLYEATAICSAELAPEAELKAEIEAVRKEREILQQQISGLQGGSGRATSEGFDIVVASEVEVSCRSSQDDTSTKNEENKRSKEFFCFVGIVLVVIFTVVGLVAVITLNNGRRGNQLSGHNTTAAAGNNNTVTAPPEPPLTSWKPMLQSVRERGYIRCRAESFEVRNGHGFSLDLCKAVAAAIFGDPTNRTSFPYFPFREQFFGLANRSLDLATSQTTFNMYRDVHEARAKEGFSLSKPYYFSGTIFAGSPRFVECADNGDSLLGACRELSICVIENTVTKDVVTSILPGSPTHLVSQSAELFEQFALGTCNVIAGNPLLIYEDRARDAGYTGEYVFGSKVYARDPFSMVTQGDDPQWADFVNWVLNALITAEASNITQQTAREFPTTTVFGSEYKHMFINAIAAVGNYGEMYERHYESRAPRQGMNMINYGDSGLMYSHPLGEVQLDKDSVSDYETNHNGGALDTIYHHGYLRCGITTKDEDGKNRIGLAEWNDTSKAWTGLDVDFCRAVAAGIFAGKIAGGGAIDETIVFVNLVEKNRYAALANHDVDLLAGGKVTLKADVHEPKTKQGYSFSPPYYYYDNYFKNKQIAASEGDKQQALGDGKGMRKERLLQSKESGQAVSQAATTYSVSSAISLVTREDDSQWSDFVNWVVWSTVYAEEFGVDQKSALLMPVVELFGMTYRQMFRDVILTVGNYGEIYRRNLESGENQISPRAGRNLLNTGGPQLYPFSFQNDM